MNSFCWISLFSSCPKVVEEFDPQQFFFSLFDQCGQHLYFIREENCWDMPWQCSSIYTHTHTSSFLLTPKQTIYNYKQNQPYPKDMSVLSNVPSNLCARTQIVRWAHTRKHAAHTNFSLEMFLHIFYTYFTYILHTYFIHTYINTYFTYIFTYKFIHVVLQLVKICK